MKVGSYIVFSDVGEMHFFDTREEYLAFVKDREDLAFLYMNSETLFERLKELYEVDDALVWLDELDVDDRSGVIAEMEYRNDSKDVLVSAYKNRDGE